MVFQEAFELISGFLSIKMVAALLVVLLFLDLFDILSDSSRRLDLVVKTAFIVVTGYLIISAGASLL